MPTRDEAIQQILAGRGMRGSAAYGGGIVTQQQLDAMPPWLRAQFQARYQNDDNGQTLLGYENYDLRDEAGKPFRQINEANMAGDPRHNNNWQDPSRLRYDDALGLGTDPDNMTDTPDASFTNGLHAVMAAIAMAGGYAAYLAATGAAGAAAAADVGITSEATAAQAAAGIDPSLLSHVSGAIPAGGETALSAAPQITSGGGLAGLGSSGIDPSLLGHVSGAVPPGADTALTAAPGITSGGTSLSSFLGANGGNLARLGLAGLGATAGRNTGGAGSSGGAGTTDVNSIIEQMANANRVNQTSPLGSRTWTQDANGRWSVADAMNPAEQANFENVQGMNADVTGMARQRLAAMLANPSPRPRADAPLNVQFGGF